MTKTQTMNDLPAQTLELIFIPLAWKPIGP